MLGELKTLWSRGHYHELFGYTDDSFTALDLAARYSSATQSAETKEDKEILSKAFATLNAPLSRQLYEDCRRLMRTIQERTGDESFLQHEDKIWDDLWKWVSERWKLAPPQLVEQLIQRYGPSKKQPAKTSVDKGRREKSTLSQRYEPAPSQPISAPMDAHLGSKDESFDGCGCLLGFIGFLVIIIFAVIGLVDSNCNKTEISLDKTELSFLNVRAGTFLTDEQNVTLIKKGSSDVNGKVTTDRGWLKVNPADFKMVGDTQVIKVQASVEDINKDFTDTGTIIISTNYGEYRVIVKLTVTAKMKAPEFTLKTLDGRIISLKELRGKRVLLYFWCTCPKHRRQIIYIQNMHDMCNNFTPVIITNNTYGNAKELLSEYQIDMDVNIDYQLKTENLYGFNFMPVAILIDPDGYTESIVTGDVASQGEFIKRVGITTSENTSDETLLPKSPLSISNVEVVDITNYSAVVRWDTDQVATSKVTLEDVNSNKSISSYEDSTLTTKHMIYLANLKQSRDISIESEDINNNVARMELTVSIQNDTYEMVSAIHDIQVTNITDNSAQLKWSTLDFTTCYVTIMSKGTSLNKTSGTEHTMTLTGLTPDKTYIVQILANNKDRTANRISKILSFKTLKVNSEKIILEDTFNDINSGWDVYELTDAACKYDQGGLSIKFKDIYWCHGINKNLPTLDEFIVETDVKWVAKQPALNGYYGIDYEELGTSYYYRYVVDANKGTYMIAKLYQDEWYDLRSGISSSAINKGNAVNKMKIARKGATMEFYINDTLIRSIIDNSFDKGNIYLVVGTFEKENEFVEAAYDNFKVTRP